jgi:hypothetical protein
MSDLRYKCRPGHFIKTRLGLGLIC